MHCKKVALHSKAVEQCTEVQFASFYSGGFIIVIEVNPPERRLAKRIFVQCAALANTDIEIGLELHRVLFDQV